MPEVRYTTRRRAGNPWPLRLLLLGMLGLAIYAIVDAEGLANRFRLATNSTPDEPEKTAPPPLRDDQVQIFVAARTLEPYVRIEIRDIRGVVKNRAAAEASGVLIEPADFLFRVPVVEIPAGNPFRERDLAPKGSRAGVAAGIPPGWGSLELSRSEVGGDLQGLKVRDTVGLLAARDVHGGRGAQSLRVQWVTRQALVLQPIRRSSGSGANRAAPNVVIPGQASVSGSGGGARSGNSIVVTMPLDELLAFQRIRGKANLQLVLLSGQGRAEEREPEDYPPLDPEEFLDDGNYWQIEQHAGGRREVREGYLPREEER